MDTLHEGDNDDYDDDDDNNNNSNNNDDNQYTNAIASLIKDVDQKASSQ
jgi:hypothetical protein